MSFHDNDSMFKTLSHFPIYVSSYERGSICAATYQLHDMLAMFLKLSLLSLSDQSLWIKARKVPCSLLKCNNSYIDICHDVSGAGFAVNPLGQPAP